MIILWLWSRNLPKHAAKKGFQLLHSRKNNIYNGNCSETHAGAMCRIAGGMGSGIVAIFI